VDDAAVNGGRASTGHEPKGRPDDSPITEYFRQ
jgi:hypothetical protein